jgi:hypothetical protein
MVPEVCTGERALFFVHPQTGAAIEVFYADRKSFGRLVGSGGGIGACRQGRSGDRSRFLYNCPRVSTRPIGCSLT